MERTEALMNLEKLEPISLTPTASRIKMVFDEVSAKIEKLKIDKIQAQRDKIDKMERDQHLQAPYKDIKIPENIKLTTQIQDVIYNFAWLPEHWESENSGILSDTIDLLRDKISIRLFPEGFDEEIVKELELAVFALLFDLSMDLSKLIYPIYQTLYLANEYVISRLEEGRKEESLEERRKEEKRLEEESITFESILDLLRKVDPEDFRDQLDGDVLDYVKIIIYRALLERIGNVTLPRAREKNALNVSRELLMKLIPTSKLLEVGVIGQGDELSFFERPRILGERAKEIGEENALVMTDPGPLTDPLAIAEKELEELVLPIKVCRPFPDGSERIWCASSLAKSRDEFYDFLKEDLDKVSVEGLHKIAIEHGYSGEIRDLLLDFVLGDLGMDIGAEFLELRTLSETERVSVFEEIKDLLLKAGISPEDLNEPLYILRLLLPIMKTYPSFTRLLVVDVCSNFFDIYSDVNWVNIPGNSQTDPIDRPRRLYRDEIDDILSSVPQVKSALKGLSIEARESMQEKMRGILEDIEMCPSGIPELKQTIIVQFNKSRIDPGSAVGINAADALGEQVSQMTLNAFHSAGSNKNMSSGIRALSELIYAMKTRKNNNCVIVFKDRLSFNEILEKEADIVQTNVGQLVVDYDVQPPEKFERYWWESYFELPEIDETTRVLRLQLNPVLMVERKVTMVDVVRSLDRGQGKDGIPPESMYYAHSSTSEGIIDIYPNPKRIKQPVAQIEQKIGKGAIERTSHREHYRADVFLNNIVLANLDNIHIRGVLDIEEIYVSRAPVLEIVSKEYKVGLDERSRYDLKPGETYWKIVYDVNLLAYSPIKPEMLLELLEFVGFEVVVSEAKECIVRFRGREEGRVTSVTLDATKSKPSEIVKSETDAAEKVEEKSKLTDYQKRLLYLENYNLLNTRGSNLVGLMEKMDIDMYYTYSNNIHLVKEIYGVEAARQFFIKELYDAFTNQDGYVNARNISLLADFLFRYGSFLGTNYTGMKAGTMGYFSLATFERSLEVLVKAAIFSETETLEGISAAIAVGKPVTIGTGFFSIISEHASNAIRSKKEKESKRRSDANAITLAMRTDVCPGSFGDEKDDLSFRKNFFDSVEYDGGATLEDREEEGPSEVVRIEVADEPSRCPVGDVVQPSEMLEEAMESLPFGGEAPDMTAEEIKTQVIEIPSQIRQSPLRAKGIPVGSREPVAPEGTSLSRIEEEEISELEGPMENIEFADIPVIQMTTSSTFLSATDRHPPDNPKNATVYLISGKKIIEASESGKYDLDESSVYDIGDIELVYPGIREVVKRGDIFEDISVAENHRGSAQFFFDGEKTIPPGTTVDAYGEPPKEFEIITEFLPGYWNQGKVIIDGTFEAKWKSEFNWHTESPYTYMDFQKLGIPKEVDEGVNYFTFEYGGRVYAITADAIKIGNGWVTLDWYFNTEEKLKEIREKTGNDRIEYVLSDE